METSLSGITQSKIQNSVDSMKKVKAPKYVQTAHGLLSAVLGEYCPDLHLNTELPHKKRPEMSLPEKNDISSIMDAVKGTEIEIPILMALRMGMRTSEIRGATFDCIRDHRLHINKAVVDDSDGNPALKDTKTEGSDRWVKIPAYLENLIRALPYQDGYVVPLTASALRNRFYRLQKKTGLSHFSIHGLRHANAAVMLRLGVENKYAQERGGWATDSVLKTVYQYTMQDKMDEVDNTVDAYFDHIANEKANKNSIS